MFKRFIVLFTLCCILCSSTVQAAETCYCDSAVVYWTIPSRYSMYINTAGYDFLTIKVENTYAFCLEDSFGFYYRDVSTSNTTPLNELKLVYASVTTSKKTLAGTTCPWSFYSHAFSADLSDAEYIVDKEYDSISDMLIDMGKYSTFYDYKMGIFDEIGKGSGDGSEDDEYLPLLSFNVKQAYTVASDGGSVKYTFDWSVSQHDIYANNPNKYKVQMLASAKYTESTVLGTTTVNAEDLTFINNDCKTYISSAIPIYKESYSFLEKDYRYKLCDIAGVSKFDSSEISSYYFVYVRVVDPDTGKCSLWKCYKMQGRKVTPQGLIYDDSGNSYTYTDDSTIDDDANYDSDPKTDDVDDPYSPNYNDGAELDANHLLNNLEEIVATLKGIPDLFQKVFLWMPDYLIVLIATSIGLIVVVGFVKMFLR